MKNVKENEKVVRITAECCEFITNAIDSIDSLSKDIRTSKCMYVAYGNPFVGTFISEFRNVDCYYHYISDIIDKIRNSEDDVYIELVDMISAEMEAIYFIFNKFKDTTTDSELVRKFISFMDKLYQQFKNDLENEVDTIVTVDMIKLLWSKSNLATIFVIRNEDCSKLDFETLTNQNYLLGFCSDGLHEVVVRNNHNSDLVKMINSDDDLKEFHQLLEDYDKQPIALFIADKNNETFMNDCALYAKGDSLLLYTLDYIDETSNI